MSKWDDRFLEMASVIGSWSKDSSTQVGCVIADKRNRIVSLGFNGPPHGVDDSDMEREERLRRTIHAEANSIIHSKRDLDGFTLYVTAPPCAQCTAKLIQAGIGHVYCYEGRADFVSRWADDLECSEKMLQEANVQFTKVARP